MARRVKIFWGEFVKKCRIPAIAHASVSTEHTCACGIVQLHGKLAVCGTVDKVEVPDKAIDWELNYHLPINMIK